METNSFPRSIKLSLRVLIYNEDGERVAHALEMDLKGYGKNNKEAIKKLKELVEMQISYAIYENDPSLISFPAEQKYFAIYEKIKRKLLKTAKGDENYYIEDIPFDDIPKSNRVSYAQCV